MKLWFYAFFMAWGMFLSIPCPFPKWDEAARRRMIACFPLIGLIVGGLWALAAWLVKLIACPSPLAALILAALPFIATGFIHLDGFSDVSDAVLSHRDLETRRKILKDPHIGAFGVIAVVLLLLAQFAVFLSVKEQRTAELSALASGVSPEMLKAQLSAVAPPSLLHGLIPSPGAAFLVSLAFIPVASRAAAALAVLNMKPMDTSQYSGMSIEKQRGLNVLPAVMLFIAVFAPAVMFGVSGLAPLAAVLFYSVSAVPAARTLGGVSGDVSGFALSIAELAGAAALVLISNALAPIVIL